MNTMNQLEKLGRTEEDYAQVLEKLSRWEYNTADEKLFESIFGEDLGQHLWGKFHKYNHSILMLWGALDLQNQRTLAKALVKEFKK